MKYLTGTFMQNFVSFVVKIGLRLGGAVFLVPLRR
jgi:hypothetical protein